MTNPYAVLGVSPSVSDDDLTAAYRKLAKKYHPDMNYGSKAAELKMQEINAAYDQIKNERSGVSSDGNVYSGTRGGHYGGAYGNPGGPWGSGQGNRGFGRSYGPFGGFGWFDEEEGGEYGERREGSNDYGERREGSDAYGGRRASADEYGGRREGSGGYGAGPDNPRYAQVDTLLRSGYYQQALRILFAFDTPERGAEWFYYSALANIGIGNRVTALRHAQEAARLEPGVAAYENLLYQLGRGSYAYRQAGASQGFAVRNIGRALMQCLFSQLLCYCFCCRPC